MNRFTPYGTLPVSSGGRAQPPVTTDLCKLGFR